MTINVCVTSLDFALSSKTYNIQTNTNGKNPTSILLRDIIKSMVNNNDSAKVATVHIGHLGKST